MHVLAGKAKVMLYHGLMIEKSRIAFCCVNEKVHYPIFQKTLLRISYYVINCVNVSITVHRYQYQNTNLCQNL